MVLAVCKRAMIDEINCFFCSVFFFFFFSPFFQSSFIAPLRPAFLSGNLTLFFSSFDFNLKCVNLFMFSACSIYYVLHKICKHFFIAIFILPLSVLNFVSPTFRQKKKNQNTKIFRKFVLFFFWQNISVH